MSIELWLAFTVAVTVLLAIPGPTVILVVSYVIGRGRESAWATVPGVVLGDFTAMSLSLLGAGALLQASSSWFSVLKIAGALYLVWLGIKLWREKPQPTEIPETKNSISNKSMFLNSYIVTSLNPKGIVFFIAFLPQFLDPAKDTFSQFVVMEITFLSLAAVNIILWVFLVDKLREGFKQPTRMKIINKIGGSFLIGAGMLAVIAQPGK